MQRSCIGWHDGGIGEPRRWQQFWVFGDKVSIMAYGDEPVGLIIENKEVARSFKQIWDMMDSGVRRKTNYTDYPMRVEGIASDSASSPENS